MYEVLRRSLFDIFCLNIKIGSPIIKFITFKETYFLTIVRASIFVTKLVSGYKKTTIEM